MNILVTGATGFLGNAIIGKLLSADNQVIGIRRDENRKSNLRHTPDIYVRGDIRDYDFIRRVIADYEIEEIHHCAAQAIVRSCANDPYTTFDINVMGTVALLEACRNSGETVKSVVISTSDKSFGHTPPPYNEDTRVNPLYTYEVSKACQHLASLNFFNNYQVPVKIIASSNVYGPGDPNFSRIIPNTVKRLAEGQKAILNDGVAAYIREFVYVDDVADAFILVSREGTPGDLYCCGGTEHLSIEALIRKICVMMDKDPDSSIEIVKKANNFKEIAEQWIDASKLKKLGWSPAYSLDDGLKKTIEFYSGIAR